MRVVVLTIFPELFEPFFRFGIVGRAVDQEKIQVSILNIRDFTSDKHHTTDDRPFGGGWGMVMKPEPLAKAISAAKVIAPAATTLLMTPQGRAFDQSYAGHLSAQSEIILVCGRYEGIDERISLNYIDEEISIGDYVLTGGEPAAMLVIDAVTRLIPGVLGCKDSAENDSFTDGLLEYAHYTRPRSFDGHETPPTLLSGNHREIEKWRQESSLIRTFLKRPDLLKEKRLNGQEVETLRKWRSTIEDIIDAQSLSRTGALSGDR